MLLALFILLGFANSSARGEITVKQFDKYEGQEVFKLYIRGVGDGYSWANTALANNKQRLLFCAPVKLTLSVDQYLQIIHDTIKGLRQTGKNIEDFPVEMVLLLGLQEMFPCTK